MALSAGRSRITQLYVNRSPGASKVIGRAFSVSTRLHESESEENSHERKIPLNPLLHVQTHTGVRNMAHGLHILRQIEKKFGAIESYLFPRESGTNEYHPAFFFRFSDPKSIRRLAKPYTHFDVPLLTSEDKPNHAIGIGDVSHLISSSHEFTLARGLELMKQETGDSVDTNLEEDAALNDPGTPSTLKSRYAVRIAVSGLDEYPQPFFSHKTINPREKPRIERELATWKSAYEVLGPTVEPPPRSEIRPKIQSIEELLQENFNVPRDIFALSQKNDTQESMRQENNGSEYAEPTEYQLFKVHSRRSIRPVNEDPPLDTNISAGTTGRSSAEEVESDNPPAEASPMRSTPRLSAKRERQLEQMRRAAASQVRSIAEKRRIEEEVAKQPKAASEAPAVKQEPSLWDRFLKR
ncbi:unnamed protein product [Rhizoctonia solani]|uniref:Uncharacterized protein n=1 Tax=Rhizoctonia solani TaxID=456999 RepID=A0A8H3GLP1_9AGAM|nr:unnamed protein product [Rhizoctonia solani]